MDWRLSVTLGLLAVILTGFAWYERSRPSSRVVAIVAALTALAVAGRLVFTPIPNVVATTDIALLTGYALGGAPGFAVGALAAPISNIWLGQGPWTPWQMAGWGLAGLVGAGLAAASGRRLGRLPLALACAGMGLAYGALLDLSVMVTYGGEQSLDRYLTLSARGVPFNFAHALGNFAIALAAGPALVRMIARYRERLTFTWHPGGAIPALLGAVVLATSFASPQEAHADFADARSFLLRNQNPDGGFAASAGQPSSAAMTTWAALGLEAAGVNPLDATNGGRSPIDFLRRAKITSATDLERTILALEAAGIDSRSFEGHDLVAQLRAKRQGDGSWEGQVNITAFGILALRAAGQSDVGESAGWLRGAQNSNGGWGFAPGRGSEADSTGAAMQALGVAGGSSSSLTDGARYLAGSQKGDGGWTLAGGVENSQSTAWAVQGLVAAGGPGGVISKGNGYIGRRQSGDGHYSYSSSSDQTPIWVTSQSLLAIAREPFPIATVPRAPKSAPGESGGGADDGSSSSSSDLGAGPESAKRGRGATQKKDGHDRADGDSVDGTAGGKTEPAVDLEDTVVAESASSEEARDEGLSGGEKAGIALGALALILAGGYLWNRRAL